MSVLEYLNRNGEQDYENAMMALGSYEKYIKEKQWNKYAFENNYLGSISLKRLTSTGSWTVLYFIARKRYLNNQKIVID